MLNITLIPTGHPWSQEDQAPVQHLSEVPVSLYSVMFARKMHIYQEMLFSMAAFIAVI